MDTLYLFSLKLPTSESLPFDSWSRSQRTESCNSACCRVPAKKCVTIAHSSDRQAEHNGSLTAVRRALQCHVFNGNGPYLQLLTVKLKSEDIEDPLYSGPSVRKRTIPTTKNVVFWDINLSSYLTGDTLRLHYTVQPVNAM
jgi:hypothetical protein